MGLAELLKSVTKNNRSNPRTLLLVKQRVKEIAKEADRRNDTETTQKLEGMLRGLDLDQSQFTQPADKIKKLQKVDEDLDRLQVPSKDRRKMMEVAATRDRISIETELMRLPELLRQADYTLQSLIVVLNTLCDYQEDLVVRDLLGRTLGEGSLDTVCKSIAIFNDTVATLGEKQIIDKKSAFTLSLMDNPDRERKCLIIPPNCTFGELGDIWIKRSQDPYDAIIPDFWIHRQDPKFNVITETGRYWEFGDDSALVCDAFKDMGIQHFSPHIDVVEHEREYIVALIEDEAGERAKILELLTRGRRLLYEHLDTVFVHQKVSKVLKLQDGTDISGLKFDRSTFRARTNPLYIRLEGTEYRECQDMSQDCHL